MWQVKKVLGCAGPLINCRTKLPLDEVTLCVVFSVNSVKLNIKEKDWDKLLTIYSGGQKEKQCHKTLHVSALIVRPFIHVSRFIYIILEDEDS